MPLSNQLNTGSRRKHSAVRNELKHSGDYQPPVVHEGKVKRFFRVLILFIFFIALGIYTIETVYDNDNSFENAQANEMFAFENNNSNANTGIQSSSVDNYDSELLDGMGKMMEEMGYGTLTDAQLANLRDNGVTATFTSRMRDLGYTDITLEELKLLGNNDVSFTFSAMMNELGYELTVQELVELERHNVTAYFTSNIHDLGYTDVTTDELMRMKDVGVSIDLVKERIEDTEGAKPTIEEIIRYRISNQ